MLFESRTQIFRPETFFKMLPIGYLLNVQFECDLEQEVILNIVNRWFLGLDLSESYT
ncbi:transposase [Peribacillus butanolivorans]|uniref:transposase n=1 Tax=Peribacillus butanolivorans TaxID=421767 RepID=UPI0036DD94C9